ncbi:hypothetical protein Tco_0538530 [Tanacetum coccineum]
MVMMVLAVGGDDVDGGVVMKVTVDHIGRFSDELGLDGQMTWRATMSSVTSMAGNFISFQQPSNKRMYLITDIKSALTQRALQIFCETYHIPDEVHPQLPNPNQTIHEMPTGKIGVYTRFFEYANFRLPLSTFLVDVLRYYHIHISQLSVIGAAKVSHFEVLCRVHGFEPTSTSKGVLKDPFPKSSEFNAKHYVILVAHPTPFHKYSELFLCLVGISRYYTLDVDTYHEFLRDGEIDLLSFIQTADPMKVRVGERQRTDDEPQILETIVGRVVPLLSVALACTSSELEASVDRLFGEGDGGKQVDQGDSAGGGKGVDIQPTVSVDASGPSHPPKKLREDYRDPSGPFVAGKPRSAVQRLLVGAVLNAKVRGEPILTLPFVTSFVSATPEHENENLAYSVTGPNSEPSCSAKSSTPIIATATVDAAGTAKETPVKPSLFSAGSSSAGGTDPIPGGFSDASGSDFLIGDDGRVCREMLDEFAPLNFFASIRGMEHDQLFTEFNVGAAHQVSLSAEVRMRAKYNIKEKRKLRAVVSLKERNTTLEKEKSMLDVRVSNLAATVKNDKLADQVLALEMRMVGDKLAKLEVDLSEMTLHFEEKFYPHLLTTIVDRRWLWTHGLKLFLTKCLNSFEYLSSLGAAISRAIEKGMQDGLAAGIEHGVHGRSLEDLVAYNPFAEEDYNAALQELRSVDFALLAKLKSHKDASVETIMNLLLLESPLVDAHGMSDLQPDGDQLMVPIHFIWSFPFGT